jgi:hypothetical protein
VPALLVAHKYATNFVLSPMGEKPGLLKELAHRVE